MTCVWDADTSCLGIEWDDLEEDAKTRYLSLATSSLLFLTNNRVGTCPVTIRPCDTGRRCGCGFSPRIDADRNWYNSPACGRCSVQGELALPGPVGYIDEIKVDGEPLDLLDFRLDNGHILVWQGEGPSPLPTHQDLSLPDTEPDTFSVTYSQSYPIGPSGRTAVALLALEFARACAPRSKCALPRGVQSVTRQGVSFVITAGLFPNGLTGIDLVDQFIVQYNPDGVVRQPPAILDPRKGPPRITNSVPVRYNPGSA